MNRLPKSKSVSRQRRSCDLNPGPSAPESTRLPSRPGRRTIGRKFCQPDRDARIFPVPERVFE